MKRLFVLVLALSPLVGCGRGSSCPPFVGAVAVERRWDLVRFDDHLQVKDRITRDGSSTLPAISPDGTRLAFSSGRGHSADPETGPAFESVYVADLDGGHVRRLTHGEVDRHPTWTADGRAILYERARGADLGIRRVELDSGKDRLIANRQGNVTLSDPTAAPKGGAVVAVATDAATGGSSLWLLDRAGSVQRDLGPWPVGMPAVWAPDGRRIAYTELGPVRRAMVLDVRSGERRLVPGSQSASTQVLAWTADDRLVLARNVRGPGVAIVTSEHGRAAPEVLVDRSKLDLTSMVVANPAC